MKSGKIGFQDERLCCLCGENKVRIIRSESGGKNIIQCRKCGLISRVPFPDCKELSKTYEESYYDGQGEIGYKDYLEQREELLLLARDRLKIIMRYIKTGKLLDVGCATGEFLEVADELGWDVSGIEISNFSSSVARERTGLDIQTGTLAQFTEKNKFNVVTMWDVLEHVIDPFEELKKIYNLLEKKGLVVICTPNVSSIRAIREKSNWHGYRVSQEHIYFFEPKTLENMLKKAGFKKIIVQTTAIDLRWEQLLNPFSDCSKLPVNILNQRCSFVSPTSLKKLILFILERINLGHILLVIARK